MSFKGKYLDLDYMSDYIINDPEVVSVAYLQEEESPTLDENGIRQVVIGYVATLFYDGLINAVEVKKLSEIAKTMDITELRLILNHVVTLGCFSDEFADTMKGREAFKEITKGDNFFRKFALFFMFRGDKEVLKIKLRICSREYIEELMEQFEKDLETLPDYKYNTPLTLKQIEKDFRVYNFKNEEDRQSMYRLWLFVCDIPEVWMAYIKKAVPLDELDADALNRVFFYRRLVDPGCMMDTEQKLKLIKAFEFD